MNAFEWNKNFETGIEEVDRQHLTLVDLVNSYGRKLTEGELDIPEIQEVFDELVAYALTHFKDEEKLMENSHLDRLYIDLHTRKHVDFLAEVTSMRSSFDTDKLEDLKQLLDFLIRWLAIHILGTDQNMARQIIAVNQGTDPSEAYATEEGKSGRSTEPLIEALNKLFEDLTNRNRELVQLNETLEEQVAERTRELSDANSRLEELALTDVLTNLYNRRYAMRSLETLWNESLILDQPIGCMMIDADSFKTVNDTYGHDAGDKVLIELSRCISDHIRTDDIPCRLGGDEFLLICPNTDAEGMHHVAGIIKNAVNGLRVSVGGGHWRGSVSIGIAVGTDQMTCCEEMVAAADRGVYAAKAAGRNCIRFDPDAS
ncbi:MAG: bacteriohemerythrin [Spirochaetaceae bacterium]|nr:bacteriohemerythrin [Spirochaetaceae bacterium]MDT8299274.1 bacteriohemerythrin [Spirochaetaceae bacterium]